VRRGARLALGAGLALLAAACGSAGRGGAGTGAPSAAAVAAWAQASDVGETVKLLGAYVAAMDRDLRTGTPGDVRFDCFGLRGQAVEGNAELPAPDAALSAELAGAYKAYYTFAERCITEGGRGVDPARSTLAAAARADLEAAAARYRQLTGRAFPKGTPPPSSEGSSGFG
jgi:hypothetical protein